MLGVFSSRIVSTGTSRSCMRIILEGPCVAQFNISTRLMPQVQVSCLILLLVYYQPVKTKYTQSIKIISGGLSILREDPYFMERVVQTCLSSQLGFRYALSLNSISGNFSENTLWNVWRTIIESGNHAMSR